MSHTTYDPTPVVHKPVLRDGEERGEKREWEGGEGDERREGEEKGEGRGEEGGGG